LNKNIKEILNPYFTTKKKGTGLGLSIVNKIINDHNGNIEFVPKNDGAIIKIIYKIMSAEILIVDDNADIRNIINELIIDAGYKTRIAANYNQALAEIDKKLPDVAYIRRKIR
jgi:PleD family two-component response regulator